MDCLSLALALVVFTCCANADEGTENEMDDCDDGMRTVTIVVDGGVIQMGVV